MEFSNQTLHEMMKVIQKDVSEIKEHVKKQNGRISKLENWRSAIIGGSVIINMIVVPLVLKMFLER